MKILKTAEELKSFKSNFGDAKIAFVPTMGALHDGHLSLIREAKDLAHITIVSIFVNPLQFGPNEDYTKYPSTLEEDSQRLENLGVDYLFCPDVKKVKELSGASSNPDELSKQKHVWMDLLLKYKNKDQIKANPDLANKLCGLSRPGHFDGVCIVVKLLLDLIKPDFAIFGEKDYQQLMIIKDMVDRYKLDLEIVVHPIVRETSGLAMSSRNQYLNKDELKLAASIFQELKFLKKEILKASESERGQQLNLGFQADAPGGTKQNLEQVLENSKTKLLTQGINVEYLEILWNRIFIAAKIGKTRLIDNLNLL